MKIETLTRAVMLFVFVGMIAAMTAAGFIAFTVYEAVAPLAEVAGQIGAALAAK